MPALITMTYYVMELPSRILIKTLLTFNADQKPITNMKYTFAALTSEKDALRSKKL